MDSIISSETEMKLVERVFTKLKFTKSNETGAYVAYASRHPVTQKWHGVRASSEFPKVICVLDKKLAWTILPNVLYDVTLIPMAEKTGFVAIRATPCEFKATIETSYFPGIRYRAYVKFGNKRIVFDPYEGDKESRWTVTACRAVLEKRVDIKNLAQVIEDFTDAADAILKRMEKDGVKRKVDNENEESETSTEEKEESHQGTGA